MSYLLTQMFLYMIATFILGLLLGWLLWRFGRESAAPTILAQNEELMRERDELASSLDAARSNAFEERTEMEALRDENEKLKTGRVRVRSAGRVVNTRPKEERDESQPEGINAPRGGRPDDLQQISGVGAKVEKALNHMGFYHFDQIANWSQSEIEWVEKNLEGSNGRVTQDDWQPQARILANL